MARIPIACTLTPERAVDRVAEWRALLGHAVSKARRGAGARVVFPAGLAGRVDDLARREARCCAFLGFRVTRDESSVVLDVDAPDEAWPVVAALLDLAVDAPR